MPRILTIEAAVIAFNNGGLKLEILVRLIEPYSYHRYLVPVHVCSSFYVIATQKWIQLKFHEFAEAHSFYRLRIFNILY